MTRDYVKSGKRSLPIIPVLTGIAIGCGVALLATVLLTPLPSNDQRLIRDTEEETAQAAQDASGKPSLPPEEPARFKFYELLPNFEIIPFTDPTAAPAPTRSRSTPAGEAAPRGPQTTPRPTAVPQASRPEPPPRTPADGESYWVQAGSFRNPDDAESRRVHLILLGFAPQVEVARIPDKGTFHRVKLGPHATTAQARSVMERLAADGIDSYFVREKGR